MSRWTGVILGIAAGLLYLAIGHDQQGTDSHYLFAQAFVEGRLHIEGVYAWLELVPRPEGGWYSPFPPLLSVVLMPFAAAGVVVDTNQIAAVMGGLSVTLMWAMLGRLGVAEAPRWLLTVGWAVGSQLLWVAGEGGHHLAPQVTAAALLLGSLTLAVERRWPAAAGLLLALAATARLPVGLALPLILWLYRPREAEPAERTHPWISVLAGLVVPALLVATYDLVRFGSAFEFGYGLIESIAGERVLDEPWYYDGIVSWRYLPLGLHSMLLRGPELVPDFPWFYGSILGTSILLTMPILWWVFEARGRLALVAGATAALVMLPNLLHGNPGFAQIGYRFILDALPIFWLMLGLAFAASMSRAAIAALAFGIVANAWLGVVYWAGLAP